MSLDLNRRGFFAAATSVPAPVLASAGATWAQHSPGSARYEAGLVGELVSKLGLSESNARAMALRATRCIDRPGGLMLGNADGQGVVLMAGKHYHKQWRMRLAGDGDFSLANAIALVSTSAAVLISAGSVTMRWISSCHFGGAEAHVLRNARGLVFLIVRGEIQSIPRRIEID